VGETSIQWTDRTWNCIRGCSRVSEGCRNCYAERIAVRFSGPGKPYEGFADVPRGKRHSQTGTATCGVRGHWTGRVELIPSKLEEPLHWRKPRRVFVNSMSDLFHEALDFHDIAAVYGVMAAAMKHTFQVLTKRPERRRAFMRWMTELTGATDALGAPPFANMKTNPILGGMMAAGQRGVTFPPIPLDAPPPAWPLPNVWEGVSVEDQATADARIPLLLQTPAAKHFVSYEPALGPVDFARWLSIRRSTGLSEWVKDGERNLLDWIIVGGESGPHARPFYTDWARLVLRQCRAAGVPCFIKQLGSFWAKRHKADPKGGDPAEWPADLRVREFPK
jgi:protein gp37